MERQARYLGAVEVGEALDIGENVIDQERKVGQEEEEG